MYMDVVDIFCIPLSLFLVVVDMKNPLRKLFKDRGYPDNSHVHGGNSPSSSSAVIPSSSAVIPSSAPLPPPPAGYPYNDQYRPYTSMVQPPTAHPYSPRQDSEQVWEIDAGNNKNLKGNQKTANVRVANSAAGCAPAVNLPQNGRFVIKAGGNTNCGDLQESGNVDFGNIG